MSLPLADQPPVIELRQIAKTYGDRSILRGLDLTVAAGNLMVVYGPPASGKTVLIRLLMGLEHPTDGEIRLRGEDVTRVSAAERSIGYVPQSFALYPHLSVHDNIAYPLKLAGVKREQMEPAVRQAAAMLKIGDLLAKRPDQLSGGQKQRIAIARGIAKQTDLFVLDDPLAGLDFKLREQLVDDLKQLQETWSATFIYTTSDAIEALTLADQVAILAGGRITESGPPQRLYDAPSRVETMALLGFPHANFLAGTLAPRGAAVWCATDLFEFPMRSLAGGSEAMTETPVRVGIRPESIAVDGGSNHVGNSLRLPVRVLLREDLGGEEIVYLDARGTPLTTIVRHDAHPAAIPEETAISLDPADLVVFGPDGARIGEGAATSDV